MIVRNLEAWSKNAFSSPAVPAGTAGAETILGTMPMPDVFKNSILNNLPSPAELVDINGIVNAIGDGLSDMVLSVLCLIIMYIVLRLICGIFGMLLRKVSELPVFKQINKLGGLLLGALQGFLAVYILFAILTLFNSNPAFAPVFDELGSSMFAAGFYNNNIIINFLFPPITA
jgi:hypothetical protein